MAIVRYTTLKQAPLRPGASPVPRSRLIIARSTGTEVQSHRHHPSIIEISLQTGSKRTILLDGSTSSDEEAPTTSGPLDLTSVTSAVQNLFLPRGWPNTVTKDYLIYQYCTFPSHVTGWMSHALAGSSMLKALGMDMGAAGAVGYTAAIKWVTKDGLGAIGRMVVGGGLSSKFDEDPRRWRMLAELVTSTGLALEIATQVYPVNFILLAGTGNLCKAVGRGMGRPCFRVIQTHFSAKNNVGDVAAKEEVWEVTAQLLGLAASVGLLTTVEAAGTPEAVIPLWAVIHAAHVTLRYYSLKALRFPYPNMKRAIALVTAHVAGRPVPDVEEGNAGEAVWPGPGSCTPKVTLGCSVEEAVVGWTAYPQDLNTEQTNNKENNTSNNSKSTSTTITTTLQSVPLEGSNGMKRANGKMNSSDGQGSSSSVLEMLLSLYTEERYLLTWRDNEAWVVLWDNAGALDMMQALWQAAWLQHHGVRTASRQDLEASVRAVRSQFSKFCEEAAAGGWELERAVLPVGVVRVQKS